MHDSPCPHRQGGFTLIETMVAMLVLLVGVLGTGMLLNTALGVGQTSRSREAATNLGREIAEAARSVDYELLLTTTAPAELQGVDGLADVDPAVAGWQVRRRGVIYAVAIDACIYDDPKDGSFSANTGAGYCAGLVAGSGDANGDDYRKLVVTTTWGTRQVRLTANIVNPAGGFGPRVTGLTSLPAVDSNSIIPVANSTSSVALTVSTTPATSLNWDAGDTKHRGQLADAAGATSWSFSWPLGTVGSFTCGTPIDWVADAPAYQMTFQPFDSSGTPGDLRTQTVSIDRSPPHQPCDFDGGRNPQHGGVVDLQWSPSFEGDVVSYSVWRIASGGDLLVCAAVRATECTDVAPPGLAETIEYYVKAQQDNLALGKAFGTQQGLVIPAAVTADGDPIALNSAPAAPGSVTVVGGEQPTISWTASTDSDGSVIFYRIYRDGQAITNRYRKTSNGATLSFTDKSTVNASHTYYVSAVDDAFAESPLVQAP